MRRLIARAHRARRGFSLGELMIAVGISSILLLAVGMVFDQAITSQKRVVDHDRSQADMRLVQSYLQERLPAAVRPLRQSGDHQLEFLTYQDGQSRFVFVGRSCQGSPSLVVRSSPTPLAGAYPPSAESNPETAGQRLVGIADCESDPVRITYYGGGGQGTELGPDDDRATETRRIRIDLISPEGLERSLEFAVGIDTAAESRTRIGNGDFELPAASADPPEAWAVSGDGTATRVADGERGLVLHLSAGAGQQTLAEHDPVLSEGEAIQVSARADPGATCSLSAYGSEGTDPEAGPVSSSDPDWTVLPLLSMAGLAGRSDIRLVLSASDGDCRFDAVRSADAYQLD